MMLTRTATLLRRETALLALLALAPAALVAQGAVTARIVGQVYDSISRAPLSNATVRIVRADNPSIGRTATTDVFGRFRYDSVGRGAWLATFLHPVLDSLRLEPGIVRLASCRFFLPPHRRAHSSWEIVVVPRPPMSA